MSNWFECKVRHDELDPQGKSKKVNDTYLVDALSFSEAEARITKEVSFLYTEFTVSGIKKEKISEIFPSEADADDKWYKCKVSFITIDEEKQTERKTSTTMLVQASDLQSALDNLRTGLKETLSDTEVTSVSETTIMDIFNYEVPEN